jgi:hypothetical protein
VPLRRRPKTDAAEPGKWRIKSCRAQSPQLA